MVYTGNLVQGMLRAEVAESHAHGRAYWIADAEPYALHEILEGVKRALAAEGLSVSNRAPIRVPHLLGVFAEKVDGVLQAGGRYLQAVHVLGELKDTIACDISASRKDLGYEPTVSLVEGMRASVRFCLERGWKL
jgi:nucleoside-diphosphate-sugar epimerase